MKKIMIVFGSRPEAIKMAPLIKVLGKDKRKFNVKICVTAQHREMLDQVLQLFEIKPDYDLNIMKPNQDLYHITSKVLLKMKKILVSFNPDIVLVQGDTNTAFATSLAAFYLQIKIGHVEAGLRTGNIFSPFPEEFNRRATSILADYNFSPTEISKQNLIKENIKEEKILVTGNTIIDALYFVIQKIRKNKNLKNKIIQHLKSNGYPFKIGRKIVLFTCHRRENYGEGFINIFNAIKELANNNQDIHFVFPMHLNSKVRSPAVKILSNIENIFLIEPLQYEYFIFLMKNSYLVITDSGGIQEEAPSLGKPVLVTRNSSERPEGIKAGTVKVIGTDIQLIINEVQKLLEHKTEYKKMSRSHNPYGDGKSAMKIVQYLSEQ